MAPEHRAALEAVAGGDPVPQPVDHRADIFALGLLLREALGGSPGPEGEVTLRQRNPGVSAGLEDIIRKCLSERPSARYPDAASLADDLRRHLEHLPLRGVRNRPFEWMKKEWRRKPGALARWALWISFFLIVGLSCGGWILFENNRHAEQGLREAVRAKQSTRAAESLHRLAEHVRSRYGSEPTSASDLDSLNRNLRTVWQDRHLLDAQINPQVRADLLELMAAWAEMRTRMAKPEESRATREAVLAMLEEARAAYGPSPTIDRMRRTLAQGLGRAVSTSQEETIARTPQEHDDLGRSLLRSGQFEAAAREFRLSLEERPQDYWPNFYLGLCEHKLEHFEAAVTAFNVAIALAPTTAERANCYFDRALAAEALGRLKEANEDYERALKQAPEHTSALLNHGILAYKAGRHTAAITDLQHAMRTSSDPKALGRIHYNLGLVYLALGDLTAARASADQAIGYGDQDAWDLRDRLRRPR
jgi:tetratricopeptide (TPR) repeat protein